ncbi:alpha/beta fold hydrolase [Sandaracinus amylolyticus]|uniref:Putative hydrolase n=1 Tax=Sandaracinus amylolyticus TaxID=927083 RepID=A0A0F6YLG6_9BACT|nr:alpha/beta fold hydrolase [Sandaracinus amylolyticus]AKF10360.1 putative hydrolase [Sandaracinus amylolyticus]
MTSFVTSKDGTRIAFDRRGRGAPVIVVGGILCDRDRTRPLAHELASRLTAIDYDRRGRGESGNRAPCSLEREIEDIAALIAEVGGSAAVYGHSSGAALALNAAVRGLAITKLVLHEPPYGGDDDESVRGARGLAEQVRDLLHEDRRAEAITTFLGAAGVPPEMIEAMARDPKMLAMAPTMLHDFEVMGELRTGGVIPRELVRAIRIPTLVLAGTESAPFFRDTAKRIAELLPDGRYQVLDGQDHGAAPDVVAPIVATFVA